MLVYPLTQAEQNAVLAAQWIVPTVAVAVILFLGWMSIAAGVA